MAHMTSDSLILVGNSGGGTVAALTWADGRLTRIAETEVGAGCGTFAIDGDLVYCAVKAPEPAIVTLRLDRATGELTELARRTVDNPLAYVSVTPGGNVVLAASYHGGWGGSWPATGGVLGEQASRVDHRNVHSVITDAAGGYAYFVSLGDDVVAQYAIGQGGVLTALDPETVPVDAGAGARHIVLDADETSAYVVTEFTGEAIRFDRDPATGVLTRAESVAAHDTTRGLAVSRFGADPKAEALIWGADLHLVDGGRRLVCSERSASVLATVDLDADGHLGEVVAITDTETQPRGFTVAPDGLHVVVVGEGSGHASIYRVGDDGTLITLDRVETGRGPSWVRFA